MQRQPPGLASPCPPGGPRPRGARPRAWDQPPARGEYGESAQKDRELARQIYSYYRQPPGTTADIGDRGNKDLRCGFLTGHLLYVRPPPRAGMNAEAHELSSRWINLSMIGIQSDSNTQPVSASHSQIG